MPPDPNKKQVSITYQSDDGNEYALTLHHNHAVASGGFASTGQPGYPRGWTPRVVHGVSADGLQHTTLAIANSGLALFQDANATFTIAGVGTFTKTGSTGEKRPRLAPPLT